MNKRIHDLMIDATSTSEFIEGNYYWPPQYVEKFAKLIVQECIQFIEEENVRLCEYQNSLPEWEGNKRDDCDLVIEKCIDLSERMKQHFGVKE